MIQAQNQINTGFKGHGKAVSGLVTKLRAAIPVIAKFGGAAATAGAAFTAAAVKLAADAEQTMISFEVLTDSAAKADKLIAGLRKRGQGPPFGFADLARGTQMLLKFGVATDKVLGDIDALTDISAGNKRNFLSLAVAYGQVRENTTLMGQEVRQFINAGFNPLRNIADRTGESMQELKERMKEGGIAFSEVRRAIMDATSEGGRFHGMSERMGKTVGGQLDIMGAKIKGMTRQFGVATIEATKMAEVIERLNLTLDEIAEKIPKTLEQRRRLALPADEQGFAKPRNVGIPGLGEDVKVSFPGAPSEFARRLGLVSARRQLRGESALPSLEEAEQSGRRLASRLVGQIFGGIPGQAGFLQQFAKTFGPGGAVGKALEPSPGLGQLAQGTKETFDVLRANTQKESKQQSEMKKQGKTLQDMKKLLKKVADNTKSTVAAHFEVKGLD